MVEALGKGFEKQTARIQILFVFGCLASASNPFPKLNLQNVELPIQ